MTSELKPCQCGNECPRVLEFKIPNAWDAFVTCDDCNSRGPNKTSSKKERASALAVKAWNHRPIETELIEALKECAEVFSALQEMGSLSTPVISQIDDTRNKAKAAIQKAGSL